MRLRRYEQPAEERRVEGMTREQVCQRFGARIARRAALLIQQAPEAGTLSVDDLVARGMLGLLEAFDRYSSLHNSSFEAFAILRISGEMQDAVLAEVGTTRRERKLTYELARVQQRLTAALGRAPEHHELASAMKLPLHAYWALLQRVEPTRPGEHRSGASDSAAFAPEAPRRMLAADERRALLAALERLPERELLAVQLYYGRDCSLAEAGAIMEVSPSRVCQMLSDARARLRKTLGRVDVDLFAIEELGAA